MWRSYRASRLRHVDAGDSVTLIARSTSAEVGTIAAAWSVPYRLRYGGHQGAHRRPSRCSIGPAIGAPIADRVIAQGRSTRSATPHRSSESQRTRQPSRRRNARRRIAAMSLPQYFTRAFFADPRAVPHRARAPRNGPRDRHRLLLEQQQRTSDPHRPRLSSSLSVRAVRTRRQSMMPSRPGPAGRPRNRPATPTSLRNIPPARPSSPLLKQLQHLERNYVKTKTYEHSLTHRHSRRQGPPNHRGTVPSAPCRCKATYRETFYMTP